MTNENNLICELNEESYLNMAEIIEQFLDDNNSGFNWLIDIVNSEFDLLMNDTISW